MQRFDLPYLLVGAGTAAGRRASATLRTGARATAAVTSPAISALRSTPLAAPVERTASAVTEPLVADGRASVEHAGRSVEDALNRATTAALDTELLDATVDRLLSSGAIRRVIATVINHPATDDLFAELLDSPAVDRIAARVIDSRLFEQLVSRLLESDELRRLEQHFASSPEMRVLVSRQTAGFAQDVTAGMRLRTATADDKVERAARSLLRRPRRVAPD